MAEAAAAAELAPGDWGLVGHDQAREFLVRSDAAGRLAHALLITGPPGVGREPLARAFTRYQNCQGDPRPCGSCGPCRRQAHGTFVDLQVIEVERDKDGRVRQGILVEQIRDVIEATTLPPMDGVKKTFLFPEANLLTVAAANALLKTLEEPPAFVQLILLAPTLGSVLPTIASRCFHLRLRPVPTGVIEMALMVRYGLPPAEANQVALTAGGMPGVALTLAQGEAAGAAYRQADTWLAEILEGERAARLRLAATLAERWGKDRDGIRLALRRWLAVLDTALVPGRDSWSLPGPPRMLDEVVAAISAIQATLQRVDHMQARLAFDVLMLDLDAALTPVPHPRTPARAR